MEYVLLAIVLLQSGAITYLLTRNKPKELSVDEMEKLRRDKIEKSFQKLFNYNEDIALRGYKDERQ